MNIMNKKYLNVSIFFWLSFIVASASFILFPQIDIYVSNLFYDGKSFFSNGTILEEIFYYSVKPLLFTLTLGVFFIYLFNKIKKRNILNINAKVLLYILLVVGIAPGLIVNATFKENWERARPSQIILYGGNKEFTPAFVMSDQGGYSFSSGHAAAAFSLFGFALLAVKRRTFWIWMSLSYGLLVSVARVAAGGHFFSDVITSFFIVYIFTQFFYSLILKKD